jgi:hypothetical protein
MYITRFSVSDFKDTLIHSQVLVKYSNKISRKSVQLKPSCPMRTDGQTDITKSVVAFRNFAKAPKMTQLMIYSKIIAVCSQIHTKQINTLCGQNVEFLTTEL